MSSNVSLRIYAALVLFVCVGCQPEAAIKTYEVKQTAPPRRPLDVQQALQQLDHILVAIVPQGNKAWFFKLGAKAPIIKRQRAAFESFLATVKLADASDDTPSWTLPEGWEEKAASGMRAATLVLPDADGDLQLAVSSLSLNEDWQEFLVPNVNRWLGQLQQKDLPKATILKLMKELPVQNAKAAVFELSGTLMQRPMGGMGAAGGMTGDPHAGLGITIPSSAPTAEPTAGAPVGQPPTEQSGQPSPLTYTKPEAWLEGKKSSMRKAAFFLPGGREAGEVTVTKFPAAPGTQMADVGANVQRWAGQVGLTGLTDEQIEELTEPITISGVEGSYAELNSPAEAERTVAIYVAMVNRDGQVWFFKMVGQADAVRGQRDAFREFLSSVKLP